MEEKIEAIERKLVGQVVCVCVCVSRNWAPESVGGSPPGRNKKKKNDGFVYWELQDKVCVEVHASSDQFLQLRR